MFWIICLNQFNFSNQALWPYWASPQWAQPPCPHPIISWAPQKHVPAPTHDGLLGPRPAQSYYTRPNSSCMGYTPMNIDQAMHTLSLSSPNKQFYMDTDANSHMTRCQGSLLNYSLLKHPLNNGIIIGSV